MSKKVVIDLEELERFLDYLNDKVFDGYKRETTRAVKEFLEDLKKRNRLSTDKHNSRY
ncbi:hypothetical protein Calkr_0083 [Caldicellulosiruptor acetigenus I77R1B]|uniref:Uncharacterized protein n=1 Tax=Caldicellulosiruptor acetigenus (strain ATCC 700853 / DSM 12137 / I77R1B) TaxID=632335 RepID=E4S5Y7_CALA7|nr:hypothetical protein [Caldicellulosiruptor acetigenus]ADQ39660.1 hypothetical protein Calkr_0083 [Caldicellulosiruptor acetigenus I77R1B]